MSPVVAIHGGAGTISRAALTPERRRTGSSNARA